ncbi:MAG: hypothetical protein BWX80_02573 [Candidatus Hydrogenedentes bacterium ADurb.Bin101]|nr:MAG: hypothetical protein BWX80_02573 [Candidatus Hydrogenedentes bacterium ADurb.Bin101]
MEPGLFRAAHTAVVFPVRADAVYNQPVGSAAITQGLFVGVGVPGQFMQVMRDQRFQRIGKVTRIVAVLGGQQGALRDARVGQQLEIGLIVLITGP